MEEFNKILWDAIDEGCSVSERSRARMSFLNFRRMAGFGNASPRRRAGFFQWAVRVAAVLALPLAGLSAWLMFNKEENPAWQEVSTRFGQTTQVVLADNTRVTLNGGSTIVYPSSFQDGNRQVFFNGEGYFEVQADPEHPFDVLTNDGHLQVLGTKFNLKSYSDDKRICVSLDEGKVHFESDASTARKVTCDLVPGDNLIYDKETGMLKKNYSDADSGLWRKGEYYFKNEALGDIARDIERIFDVRVVVEREDLLSTHYHIALVNGETVDDFVRILSLDKSLEVSRSGNTIIIN